MLEVHLVKLVGNCLEVWRFTLLLIHCHLCFALTVYAFWIIGQNNYASWNYLVKRRFLLFFITFLIYFLQVLFARKTGELHPFRLIAKYTFRWSGWKFSSFHPFWSVLCPSVLAYTKTSNTWNLRVLIRIDIEWAFEDTIFIKKKWVQFEYSSTPQT